MDWITQNLKVAAAVAVIAAVALFFIIWGESGPEAEINARLDRLAELVTFDQPEGQLEQVGKAKKFSELFTRNPYLVAWPGRTALTDSDALMGLFMTMRRMTSSASVSMSNRQITLEAGEKRATVTMNLRARIVINGDAESHSGRYRIELEKIDDEWLIDSAEPLDG